MEILCQGAFDHDEGQKPLQFQGAISTGFFSSKFLQRSFWPLSPGFLCNLVGKSPQNVEKIARFPDGEKGAESCHVSGCHGFFGPDCGDSLEKVLKSPLSSLPFLGGLETQISWTDNFMDISISLAIGTSCITRPFQFFYGIITGKLHLHLHLWFWN